MKNAYVFIGDNIFETLLAVSEAEQQVGLMGQEWPPPVMSFIYSQPKDNAFWMHNTPSPLDIVFCRNGEVIEICKGEPYSTKIIHPGSKSDLVIELPYGTAFSSGIKLGHKAGIIS
jgi:uncharacterized membrane protein (UPF0127 family)